MSKPIPRTQTYHYVQRLDIENDCWVDMDEILMDDLPAAERSIRSWVKAWPKDQWRIVEVIFEETAEMVVEEYNEAWKKEKTDDCNDT